MKDLDAVFWLFIALIIESAYVAHKFFKHDKQIREWERAEVKWKIEAYEQRMLFLKCRLQTIPSSIHGGKHAKTEKIEVMREINEMESELKHLRILLTQRP